MWKDIYKYMPMWQGRYLNDASAVLGKKWALQWHAVDHRLGYELNSVQVMVNFLISIKLSQIT